MTVGERIKKLREEKHITQTELADILNTTKQNIYKYENGIITNIPSDKIEALAIFFNVSPAHIMGWENKKWVMTPDGPRLGWMASQLLDNEIKQNHMIEKEAKNLAFIPLYSLKLVSMFLPSQLNEKDVSNVIKFIPYILKENEKEEDYIFVKVDNDKMRPMINRDDILLINLKEKVINESLALVTVAAGHGFICRYRYAEDYIEFEYTNNIEFPPHKVFKNDNEYNRYKPIGAVCKIIKNV